MADDQNAGVDTTAAPAGTTTTTTAAPAGTPAAPAGTPATPAAIDYDGHQFSAPQGVTLDDTLVKSVREFAKANAMPLEAAQKIVDMGVQMHQARVQANVQLVDGWASALEADPEVGGHKLAASKEVAAKALALGDPELKKFLDDTGLGQHPLLFKWAVKVGQAISTDRMVQPTGGPAPGERTQDQVASLLFPSMTKR